jgi:low affinity Fe/Cu permease
LLSIVSIQKGSGGGLFFVVVVVIVFVIAGFPYFFDYDNDNRFADNDMIHQSCFWMETRIEHETTS